MTAASDIVARTTGLKRRVEELGLAGNVADLAIDGYTVIRDAAPSVFFEDLRTAVTTVAERVRHFRRFPTNLLLEGRVFEQAVQIERSCLGSSSTSMSPQRVQHTPSGHRNCSSASRHLSSQSYLSIKSTMEKPAMTQSPKAERKRRKVPKAAMEADDHTLMEAIFGKRIMRKVDALLGDEKTASDTISK